MKLAVCLYKYFPFGGLARDFVRIMSICRVHGHEIDVYVMDWQGDIPDGFNVQVLPTRGWSNHSKVSSFIDQVSYQLENNNYDLIIGFNKMPGLDLYYAADPCYLDRIKKQKGYYFHRLSKRVKFYSKCEKAVFGSKSKTIALMISDIQRKLFKQHYNTPDHRLINLPPGIDQTRKRPQNSLEIRQHIRKEFEINNDDFFLLLVGTGFKTKGVDRAIRALASLPNDLFRKTHLFIVGEGNPKPYEKLLKQNSIDQKVHFLGGRTDIPRFLLGADLLIHPARKENTGTVILEAIVAGLPVLVTETCGYAKHVDNSQSGLVITSPFDQNNLNQKLLLMLQKEHLTEWSKNCLIYAAEADLYSMPEKVLNIIEKKAFELSN
ncbi:MAG: glycosyltransferase family 4 protein [Gammaproteobacteria bacterium]